MRTYFTAAEKRPRMDEMVRVATGVEAIPCATALQAEVIELRLIASHAPRYNRRSKFPERNQWIKITEEAFPRLSVVRAVRDDDATYFGPFRRRQAAEDVVLAIYDGFPIRQCTPRLSAPAPVATRARWPAWAAAARRATGAISRRTVTATSSSGSARRCSMDVRPAVRGAAETAAAGWSTSSGSKAATIRRRLESLIRTGARFHRVRSLAACPEIVAAGARASRLGDPRDPVRPTGRGRRGPSGRRSAGHRPGRSGDRRDRAPSGRVRSRPPGSRRPSGSPTGWSGRRSRLMELTGDWAWPLHATLDHPSLVAELDVGSQRAAL